MRRRLWSNVVIIDNWDQGVPSLSIDNASGYNFIIVLCLIYHDAPPFNQRTTCTFWGDSCIGTCLTQNVEEQILTKRVKMWRVFRGFVDWNNVWVFFMEGNWIRVEIKRGNVCTKSSQFPRCKFCSWYTWRILQYESTLHYYYMRVRSSTCSFQNEQTQNLLQIYNIMITRSAFFSGEGCFFLPRFSFGIINFTCILMYKACHCEQVSLTALNWETNGIESTVRAAKKGSSRISGKGQKKSRLEPRFRSCTGCFTER